MTPFLESAARHLETAITLPLCLLVVLVVHELGHYFAARASGLRVETVTFGRGRLLWARRDAHGTLWRLHLWPLRAHVHIADFTNPVLPFRKKLFVILAGPAANFLLPVVLFFGFFAAIGQPAIPNIVTTVEIDMPAHKAGLAPGDRILSINGQDVRSMEDLLEFTRPRPEAALAVRYERQGEIRQASVLPVWTRYRDVDGVRREHGRIGLSMSQQPYKLDVVRSVAGEPVDNVDEARAALLSRMGTRTVVGLYSMDGRVYDSLVDLSPAANRNLATPGHKEQERIFFGALRDNTYLPLSAGAGLREALGHSGAMIAHVARLPFNLFPIDKTWITPAAVVSHEFSFVQAKLFIFVFFASLCSCVIGFLNLMPLPQLDGGQALLLIGERYKRRPLARREQATLIVFSLLFFYAAIFGANMDAMRGYYLFQMQKAAAAEQTD